MARAKGELWTLEEFLAFDDGTEVSYQLFDGRRGAMNPPLRGHAALVGRLTRIAGNQLQALCGVHPESGVIPLRHQHSWYQMDLIVTCTPGDFKDQFIADPVLVVGAVADHGRDRLRSQAPGLPADARDAGGAADVEHGAPGPALVAPAGRLDRAPAPARRRQRTGRAAGQADDERALRRRAAVAGGIR